MEVQHVPLRNACTMKPGLSILLALLALTLLPPSLPGAGRVHAEDRVPGSRPLNLSLPRESRLAEGIRFGSESQAGPDISPPDLLQQEGSHNARLPYGSGYEARQRGLALGDRLPANAGTNSAGWGRSPAGNPGRPGYGRGGMGRGR